MGCVFRIYAIIRTIIDCLVNWSFGLYFNSRRKFLPKITNGILLESGTSLARKIRNKEVTSEEVVKAFIDRINEVNHILNAVVDNRFEEALNEAREIDQNIKNGLVTEEEFDQKPFLGVPFTTKETTACKGLSWSFGLLCRKGAKATWDAKVVELMKKSGGILLGVTNVPQLNRWPETYNPIYGVTNNPYNTTKNVGGSSGGEGSIIAALGSPLGIGTDIAGSIRIPCFRCGLFGHKTTADIINTKGLTFREGNEGPTMVVAGPMSRHSEDLLPMLKVLVGDTEKLNLDAKVEVKKLNVFYVTELESFLCSPISGEIQHWIKKCVNYLGEVCDKKPEKIEMKGLELGMKFWNYMLTKEKSNFNSEIVDRTGEAHWLTETIKYFLRRSDFNIYIIMNLINGVLPKPSDEWAQKVLVTLKEKLISKLGTNGVLVFPSDPFPASYHYASTVRPFNVIPFAIWSALKFPVTQVPLGLNSEGMPIGVQIVGAPYQDHLTIAVAKELEKGFGGYVPPVEVLNKTHSE